MSTLIPQTLALLGRAAELRANGSSWSVVAAELKIADDELRSLRSANAREYHHLARRAEREFERETARACLARLRELLKSQDERIAMTAAGTIIRYELARMRHDVRAEQKSLGQQRNALRNELAPLPGSRVREQTANGRAPAAPSSPAAKPPVPSRVITPSAVADRPPGAGSAVSPPLAPQPVSALPRPKSTVMESLRRKKWIPKGL